MHKETVLGLTISIFLGHSALAFVNVKNNDNLHVNVDPLSSYNTSKNPYEPNPVSHSKKHSDKLHDRNNNGVYGENFTSNQYSNLYDTQDTPDPYE